MKVRLSPRRELRQRARELHQAPNNPVDLPDRDLSNYPVLVCPNRYPINKNRNSQNRRLLQEDQALETEVELAEAHSREELLVEQPDLKVTF